MATYYKNADVGLCAALSGLQAADAADLLGKGKNVCVPLPRIGEAGDQITIGRCFTVKAAFADNCAFRLAMEHVQPGDFILAETAPGDDHAHVGEIMLTYLFESRKISGFAIDGFVRDSAAIISAGWPVYAAGITPKGPLEQRCGEICVPVTVRGVTARPQDIVIADRDGITIVPPDMLARLSAGKDDFLLRNQHRLENSLRGIL